MAKNASRVGPKHPQVVVLVGATGDLSKRKLLPGLYHLCTAGFIPGCRIIGVSLDEIDADGFRTIAREALEQFSERKVMRGGLVRLRRDPRLRAALRRRRPSQGGGRTGGAFARRREPAHPLSVRPAERGAARR